MHPNHSIPTYRILPRPGWSARTGAILLALLLFSAAVTEVHAQFVRFSLSTSSERFDVLAEPLDFSDMERSEQVRDNRGRITDLRTGSCLQLSAPENINVLVEVSVEDKTDLGGRERPLKVEPRYINDMGACPADFRLAADVSRPFRGDGTAQFTLSDRPQLIAGMGRERQIRAFVYLLGNLSFDSGAGIVLRRQEMEYRGRFIVDVEYL